MRKIFLISVFLVLMCAQNQHIFADNSDYLIETEWTKTFGGSGEDFAYSVRPTLDGGYIVSGNTSSSGAGSYDAWLIKTDFFGNKLWDKTFGGSNSEWADLVQQTSDGGYIMEGVTYSFGAGIADAWLIKTDSSGNKLWDKTFGGANLDWADSIQQTSDGGYVVAGYTASFGAGNEDAWLIKTDSTGNKLWDKTFGGAISDKAYSVRQTSDGGYIIAGLTDSFGVGGSDDAWLIKTDSSGNKLWDKTFGGSLGDHAESVQQTSDGGYIMAGNTKSFGAGDNDAWLIKTDSSGNKLWDKTFGGSGADRAYSVQQTSDGGYILTGCTASFGSGDNDFWVIKTDSNGNELWDKTFGGSGNDKSFWIQQASDGGYVVAGYTESSGAGNSDAWLIKFKASEITTYSSGNIKTFSYGNYIYTYEDDNYYDIAGPHGQGRLIRADNTYDSNVYLEYEYYGDTLSVKNMNYGMWQSLAGGGNTYRNGTDTFADEQFGGISNQVTDASGNRIVTTCIATNGQIDAYVVKYNSSGMKQWSDIFLSDTSMDSTIVKADSQGNVYTGITKYISDGQGGLLGSFYVVKYNASGTKLWDYTYNDGKSDDFNGIAIDSKGNVALVGWNGMWPTNDTITVKLNSAGGLVWAKTYDSGMADQAGRVEIGENDKIIVYEPKKSDSTYTKWKIEYDSNGNFLSDGYDALQIGTGCSYSGSNGADTSGRTISQEWVYANGSKHGLSEILGYIQNTGRQILVYKYIDLMGDSAMIYQSQNLAGVDPANFKMVFDSGLILEGSCIQDGNGEGIVFDDGNENVVITKAINIDGRTDWFLWGDNVYGQYDNVVIEHADASNTLISTGDNPQRIAIDSESKYAYVANWDSNVITKINVLTNAATTIDVGNNPHDIAIDHTGTFAYVSNYGSGTVTKIKLSDSSKTTITTGGSPLYMAITPNNAYAYATNDGSNNITRISLSNDSATSINIGGTGGYIAIDPTGSYAIITSGNIVKKLRLSDNAVTDISVGDVPTGSIAFDPTGTYAYVVNFNSNNVTKINLATNATSSINVGDHPVWIAIDPSGSYAYVTSSGSDSITKINLSNNATSTIAVGGKSYYIAMDSAGKYAYLTNNWSETVIKVNLSDNSVTTMDSGLHPTRIAIDNTGRYVYVSNSGSDNVLKIDNGIDWTAYSFTPDEDNPFSIALKTNWQYIGKISDPGSLDLPEIGNWSNWCVDNKIVPEFPATSTVVNQDGSVTNHNPYMNTTYIYRQDGSLYQIKYTDPTDDSLHRMIEYYGNGKTIRYYRTIDLANVASDEYTYVEYESDGGLIATTYANGRVIDGPGAGSANIPISTSDLDGSGSKDLLYSFGTAAGQGVWAYENNSTWKKIDYTDTTGVTLMASADLDGNGSKDLLFNFGTSAGYWAYENNSTWKKIDYTDTTGVSFKGATDLDGNGSRDLLFNFGTNAGQGYWAYENNSTWKQIQYTDTTGVSLKAATDLDANGKQDLIFNFGTSTGQGYWAFENNSTWKQIQYTDTTGISLLASTDLDGNGSKDLIFDFGSTAGKGVWAYENNSTWKKIEYTDTTGITLMASADLDGNGSKDLIFDFGASAGYWAYENNSTWKKIEYTDTTGVTLQAVTDVDGNGSQDLVFNFGTALGQGYWIFANNSTWMQIQYTDSTGVTLMAATDLDGNGKKDLVFDFGATAGYWAYENNSTWLKIPYTNAAGLTLQAVTDLDGNGQKDLIFNFGTNQGQGYWAFENNTTWKKIDYTDTTGITMPQGDTETITRMNLESNLNPQTKGSNYVMVGEMIGLAKDMVK